MIHEIMSGERISFTLSGFGMIRTLIPLGSVTGVVVTGVVVTAAATWTGGDGHRGNSHQANESFGSSIVQHDVDLG